MKAILNIIFTFFLLLSVQPGSIATPSTLLPEQHTEKAVSKKGKKKDKPASLKDDEKENLEKDYLLALSSALIGILTPVLLYLMAYASLLMSLLILAIPILGLIWGLKVFRLHKKRKKEGRKTPAILLILAGVGVGMVVSTLLVGLYFLVF